MAVGASTQELLFMSRKKSNATQKRQMQMQQQHSSDTSSDEANANDQQQKQQQQITSPKHHAPIYRTLSSMFFKVELLSPEEANAKNNTDDKYDSLRRHSDVSTTVESMTSSVSFEHEDEEADADEKQKGKENNNKKTLHSRNWSGASNTSVDWREAEGGDAVWREKLSNLRQQYDWDELPLDELVDAQVGEAKNISILRRIGNNTLPRRKYAPPSRSGSGGGSVSGLPPSGLSTAPQVA